MQVALDFAKKDGNTLVLVTADHGHTSQIVDSTPPTSLSTALTTVDGTTMKISYGTAAAGSSQQHTGTQVRIAGYGPGAANVVGLTDQTDTFFTMSRSLGLTSTHASVDVSSKTVKPGKKVAVVASGFNGDLAAKDYLGTGTGALETVALKDGSGKFTVTAPMAPGRYRVTVVGTGSGQSASAWITVKK